MFAKIPKYRKLFTDKYNSMWHFIFGIFAVFYYPIYIFFILYQLKNPFEKNLFIDIIEFLIGVIFGIILYNILQKVKDDHYIFI
jgi:hypothetical protein